MRLRVLFALIPALLLARTCHRSSDPLRFATFNIEDFPKDARQIDGAFTDIAATHASFVAVEEIGDPSLFARTARERLGSTWRFVSEQPTDHEHDHLLGLAYDTDIWQLASVRTYEDTRVDGREKATLEVRLRHDSEITRVLVVHLKSGTAGRAIRARQYQGLARLVPSPERTIVLGDFNATEESDRDSLRDLARSSHMTWASEPLACTAFWRRPDGCPRSRLDHVLTSFTPSHIEAAGACARHGCDAEPTCPLDAHEVSDHCPVVVSF